VLEVAFYVDFSRLLGYIAKHWHLYNGDPTKADFAAPWRSVS
jgi:hypothetical protein